MSNISLMRDVFSLVWKQIVQAALIIITYGALPSRNLITLVLTILIYTYVFNLLFSEGHPSLKKWLVVYPSLTLAITSGFYLLYSWAGAFGILGLTLVLCAIAALRIYQSWALFDAVTSWGADRLKDKHKEAFDIQKVVDSEQRRDTQTNGSSDNKRQEAESNEQPCLDVQSVSVLSETPMPQLSGSSPEGRPEGENIATGPVVQDVQGSIRKRTKKVKQDGIN